MEDVGAAAVACRGEAPWRGRARRAGPRCRRRARSRQDRRSSAAAAPTIRSPPSGSSAGRRGRPPFRSSGESGTAKAQRSAAMRSAAGPLDRDVGGVSRLRLLPSGWSADRDYSRRPCRPWGSILESVPERAFETQTTLPPGVAATPLLPSPSGDRSPATRFVAGIDPPDVRVCAVRDPDCRPGRQRRRPDRCRR